MNDASTNQRDISVEADAERYRWLRSLGEHPIIVRDERTGARLQIAELDDAIDVARADSAFPRFIPSTAAVARRKTLIRAAEIIEREAMSIQRGHYMVTARLWDDDDAKRDHDEMLDVARKLREEAK